MRRDRLFLLLLLAGFSPGCEDGPGGGGAPVPPPDYLISGELPFDIKVLEGTAPTFVKEIAVRQGGNVPATGARIPLPANVGLAVLPAEAGIIAAFIGPAAGRPQFDAPLRIDVPAAAPRGSYFIRVAGTAPGVADKTENTHLVRVYGPADGAAYVEVSPSEVSLTPGRPVNVTVTVTRIPPFNGNVRVTYPGAGTALPAGVRVVGVTEYTFMLGPGVDRVTRQFTLEAGDNAAGNTVPKAEVRVFPINPAGPTDVAAHVVSVR
ncbi:MAG: hypothetical protein ACREMA_16300 [Longimicrobiales bacterium]